MICWRERGEFWVFLELFSHHPVNSGNVFFYLLGDKGSSPITACLILMPGKEWAGRELRTYLPGGPPEPSQAEVNSSCPRILPCPVTISLLHLQTPVSHSDDPTLGKILKASGTKHQSGKTYNHLSMQTFTSIFLKTTTNWRFFLIAPRMPTFSRELPM